MVKIEKCAVPPESLAVEAQKAHGSYEKPDVVSQLKKDFHDKCYLCEVKPSDIEVEHLRPHFNRKRKELVFDWSNLFLSCKHCNGIKNNRKFDDKILNCCECEPEELLSQSIGEISLENGKKQRRVLITPKNGEEKVRMTAELIECCFEQRNTGIREHGCQYRFDRLCLAMDTLYKTLEKHREHPTPRTRGSLRGQLNRSSEFAGFKREFVRTHLKEYPDLAEMLK